MRRADANLRYVDRSGVMTFTSRPDKYERSKEFEPVTINCSRSSCPRATGPTPPTQYTATTATLISRYARLYGLDEDLVYAVIKAGAISTRAVSRAGACGLMQLMPSTAAEWGHPDIRPAQNIMAAPVSPRCCPCSATAARRSATPD